MYNRRREPNQGSGPRGRQYQGLYPAAVGNGNGGAASDLFTGQAYSLPTQSRSLARGSRPAGRSGGARRGSQIRQASGRREPSNTDAHREIWEHLCRYFPTTPTAPRAASSLVLPATTPGCGRTSASTPWCWNPPPATGWRSPPWPPASRPALRSLPPPCRAPIHRATRYKFRVLCYWGLIFQPGLT